MEIIWHYGIKMLSGSKHQTDTTFSILKMNNSYLVNMELIAFRTNNTTSRENVCISRFKKTQSLSRYKKWHLFQDFASSLRMTSCRAIFDGKKENRLKTPSKKTSSAHSNQRLGASLQFTATAEWRCNSNVSLFVRVDNVFSNLYMLCKQRDCLATFFGKYYSKYNYWANGFRPKFAI